MSILRSRAELAEEPRTIQFVVERICPQHPEYFNPNYADRITAAEAVMPHDAWVELPGKLSKCGGIAYRLTTTSHKQIVRNAGLPLSSGALVCEHMGRFIE